MQKGQQKKIKVERVHGASCSTTDTGTEFDVSFEIDQSELEQVSISQYETHTSDQNTCYLQEKQMCEKLADHKTTAYLHMFNSCFHLEPAIQDRDILEVNLCRPHYQKYKNYETLQSCYICDKTTSNIRSVIIPMSKIDLFSVYLNQELKVEKYVSAGKVILCLYML